MGLAVVVFFVLLIVMALLYQYAMRYVFNYRITNESIKLIVFGVVPLCKIVSRDNIEYVKEISYREASGLNMLFATRLGNRLWGRILLIRKKRGIFKNILLSPDSIDEYIDTLNRK